MNKKIFAIIILGMFFISFASAELTTFDNIKTYNETTKTVTIENLFGLGATYADIQLKSPINNLVPMGYNKVAEFELKGYVNYQDFIQRLDFYDLKNNKNQIERTFDLKWLSYEQVEVTDYSNSCVESLALNGTTINDCVRVVNGSHFETKEKWTILTPADMVENENITIGVFTDVQEGDKVDWVPTFAGVEVGEWASWTQSLNADLIAYYSFNAKDGISQNGDSLGNYDGVASSLTNTTGKIGSAYEWSGGSDYFKIDPFPIWKEGFTINFWFYQTTEQDVYLVQKVGTDTINTQYNYDGNNKVRDSQSWDGSTYLETLIPKSQWSMVTITFDGTDITMYSDSVSVGTQTPLATFTTNTNVIYFGNRAGLNRPLVGKMDEIGIWNRSLSASEVTQLNNGGLGLTWAPVVFSMNVLNATDNSSANYPTKNTPVLHHVNLETNVTLSSYIFSTNATGSWVNDSAVSISGDSAEVNVEKIVPADKGTYVSWKIFANDNENKWNVSETKSYTVQNSLPKVSRLELNSTTGYINESFLVNATIVDEDGLGEISQVNATITNTDGLNNTIILSRNGTTPFWVGEYGTTPDRGYYNVTFVAVNDTDGARGNLTSNTAGFLVSQNPALRVTLLSPTDGYTTSQKEVEFNGFVNLLEGETIINSTFYTNLSGSWVGSDTRISGDVYSTVPTAIYWNTNTFSKRYTHVVNDYIGNISYSQWSDIGGDTSYYFVEFEYANGTTYVSDVLSVTSTTPVVVGNQSNPYPGELVANITVWLRNSANGRVARMQDAILYTPSHPTFRYLSWTKNITSDTIWNIKSCYSDNTCNYGINNFTVFTDKNPPSITLTSPVDSFVQTVGDTLFVNWSISDPGLDSCWYDFNNVNTTVPCGDNSANFSWVGGEQSLTFYANDSFGNQGTSSINWTSNITFIAEDYPLEAVETDTGTFEINISYTSSDWSSSSMEFYYDGTYYGSILQGTGDNLFSSYDLEFPEVNTGGEYKNFNWRLNLTNATGTFSFESTEHSQFVSKILFSICDYNDGPLLTFNTFSTTVPTQRVNATFDSFWSIKSANGGIVALSENYQDTSESNSSWNFCVTPNTTEYTVSVDLTVDATDYTPTTHYIVDTDYSTPSTNISLYLLNDSESTLTQLIVRNLDNQPIEGAYITIQRYAQGTDTYYNVGMARSDNDGSDLAYLKWYDVWYRFLIVNDGEVISTVGPKKISDTPQIFKVGTTPLDDYEKYRNILYSLDFNNYSDNFVLSYVIPSGTSSSNCLRTFKRNVTSDFVICDKCETSTSATLYCNIYGWGNGTFIADYYVKGTSTYWIDELVHYEGGNPAIYELIGNDNGTGLAIIIAGVVVALFLVTPALGVLGAILGIILAMALGFQPVDYFAFLGLVIVGFIVMWGVKK